MVTPGDIERHAYCPACGYENTITVEGSVHPELKEAAQRAIWNCLNCGTPLALQEGGGQKTPTRAVEQDHSGGVISFDALVSVAAADVEQAASADLTPEAEAVIKVSVASVLEALIGLGVLSKGAVDR